MLDLGGKKSSEGSRVAMVFEVIKSCTVSQHSENLIIDLGA